MPINRASSGLKSYQIRALKNDAPTRPLTRTIAGQTTSIAYNANGQKETITDPQGQVTTFLYDNAKRLTGKNLSNGEKLRYTLDNAGRTIQTQTFDAQNNLATTESATYDGLNRITQRINAQNKITTYTYDANGNVTAVTDPNNLTTTTQYDALNRPILITDPLGKTVATTYNTQNLITSVRDPNNNTTTYTYSGFGGRFLTTKFC